MNNLAAVENTNKLKPLNNGDVVRTAHENDTNNNEAVKSTTTKGKAPQKFYRLNNWITNTQVTDTLHQQARVCRML